MTDQPRIHHRVWPGPRRHFHGRLCELGFDEDRGDRLEPDDNADCPECLAHPAAPHEPNDTAASMLSLWWQRLTGSRPLRVH